MGSQAQTVQGCVHWSLRAGEETQEMGLEDRNLMWQRSLRPLDPGVEDGKKKKPSWNVSSKKISASDVTNREGGSPWTARKPQPRPPRPASPPPPREPTPPPTPSPEPEPAPEPIPWRDRYQFEPLGRRWDGQISSRAPSNRSRMRTSLPSDIIPETDLLMTTLLRPGVAPCCLTRHSASTRTTSVAAA